MILFCLIVSLLFPDSRRSECPPGTYSNAGKTSCSKCDEGYQCAMGSTNPAPADGLCPQGGWCDGKNFYRCEAGLYNKYNGSTDENACVACPPGISTTKKQFY
jgi:hypothetical protein